MTNTQDLAHWLRREGANCQKHIDCADALETLTKELEAEQVKSAKARLHEMDNIRLTTERDALKAERDALEVECEKIKMDWSQDAARLTAEIAQLTAEMADQGPCINGLRDKVAALKAALVSFTKSDYIKKQHPKRYTAAVAAIAKESKHDKGTQMNWQPTCELRWVNYSAATHYNTPSACGKVLQQKWVGLPESNATISEDHVLISNL